VTRYREKTADDADDASLDPRDPRSKEPEPRITRITRMKTNPSVRVICVIRGFLHVVAARMTITPIRVIRGSGRPHTMHFACLSRIGWC